MKYPKSVLKSANLKLQNIREKNRILSIEKKNFVYSKIPQIVSYNREIAEILKSAVSESIDSLKLKNRVSVILKNKNETVESNIKLTLNAIDTFVKNTKKLEQREDPPVNTMPVPNLGWRCVCGRPHPRYESSCVCGKSKFDNMNQPKAEETEVVKEKQS